MGNTASTVGTQFPVKSLHGLSFRVVMGAEHRIIPLEFVIWGCVEDDGGNGNSNDSVSVIGLRSFFVWGKSAIRLLTR